MMWMAIPLRFIGHSSPCPSGPQPLISDPTTIQPTFVADLAGLYVAQLIVNDGTEDSLPITVTITSGNTPPVADAGPDQNVPVFSLITLNGSGSHDVDGDALTFQWTLDSRPQGSTATLLNSTFAQPTFIPDIPGTYVITVVVSDGKTSSIPDIVVIGVQSLAPVRLPTLLITSPSEGSVVGVSSITVTGFVNDPTATVTVNGIAATISKGVFLADGIASTGRQQYADGHRSGWSRTYQYRGSHDHSFGCPNPSHTNLGAG